MTVKIIREDDIAWFTECLGGCGIVHAHGKRSGIPVDPHDPQTEVVWQQNEPPTDGRYCASCGLTIGLHGGGVVANPVKVVHLVAAPSDWQMRCGINSIDSDETLAVADDHSLATCFACINAPEELTAMAIELDGRVTDLGGGNMAVIFDRTDADNYLITHDDETDSWIMVYERTDDDGQREWVTVIASYASDDMPTAEIVRSYQGMARDAEVY